MPVFSLNQRQRKYLEDFDLQHSYYSVSIQYELYWEKFRYDTTLTQLELIHHLTTRQVRNYSEGWAIKCTITTRETQQEINIENGIYSFCTSTRTVQIFEGDITKILKEFQQPPTNTCDTPRCSSQTHGHCLHAKQHYHTSSLLIDNSQEKW